MKKAIALVLAMLMVLSLAACGNKAADTSGRADDRGQHHLQQARLRAES